MIKDSKLKPILKVDLIIFLLLDLHHIRKSEIKEDESDLIP